MTTISETTEVCGMAVSILQATRGGDDLHPTDLYLVQCAVNECLNMTGAKEFDKLHNIVQTGEYNIDERWKT